MGFAAFLIAFSAVDARAECVFSPFEFFPDRNDVVHVAVESNGKGLCDISFREGPGYRFTDVRANRLPPHGIIATLGRNHYAYAPLPDFKGRDQFMFRACAIVGERKGCSTLNLRCDGPLNRPDRPWRDVHPPRAANKEIPNPCDRFALPPSSRFSSP